MPRKSRRSRGLGEVTKKDFVAIANILCRSKVKPSVIDSFNDYFGGQNLNFDRKRFTAAALCWTKSK